MGMGDINLLPHRKAREEMKARLGRLNSIAIIAGVIAVVALCVYGYLSYKENYYIRENNANMEKVKKLSSVYETKQKIKQQEERIGRMAMVIAQASKATAVGTEVLDRISEIMPREIFALSIASPNSDDISITGRSSDNDSIAYFAYKLKQSGYFKDVMVRTITRNSVPKQAVSAGNESAAQVKDDFSFSITLKLSR